MTRNTWELKLNSTILTHSKKQVDVYCIDLDSEFVDLNYIVASLIFCHFWRSIIVSSLSFNFNRFSVPFVFVVREHRLQEYSKLSRVSNALHRYN